MRGLRGWGRDEGFASNALPEVRAFLVREGMRKSEGGFPGKTGWIVLDQIRTVDRKRLTKKLGTIERRAVQKVKAVIKEMLVD